MKELTVVSIVIVCILLIRVIVLTHHQRKALYLTEIFAKAAILLGKSPWDFFYIFSHRLTLKGKVWDMTAWTFDQTFPYLIDIYFEKLKTIPEDSLENDMKAILLRLTYL